MKAKKWDRPSAVQNVVIPLILAKQRMSIWPLNLFILPACSDDIMAHAPTGFGKTAAYLIPIIQQIVYIKHQRGIQGVNTSEPFAIVILHTRDLAQQVYRQAVSFVAGKLLDGSSILIPLSLGGSQPSYL